MAPRLYDCFTFFNELDLLEMRLTELDGVVDRFVIVEAGQTFSGRDKPFHLEENLDRFARFRDKIVHLKIERFPDGMGPWEREHMQREAMLQGLADAGPDDLVMLSDVDEIPSPQVLAEIRRAPPERAQVMCLELRFFFFYLNLERRERWLRLGPRIIRRAALTRMQALRDVRGPVKGYWRDAMRCWKARVGMRRWITRRLVADAGWHFSWLGGRDAVAGKAAALPFHSRLPANMERPEVAQQVIDGTVASAGANFDIVPVDESFPRFVQEHRQTLAPHILEVPAQQAGIAEKAP